MSKDIVFKGFNPEDTLVQEAERSLNRLLELAPSDANLVARLESRNGEYRCMIDIHSAHGPFTGSARAPRPILAIKHAEDEVRHKIMEWSKRRFAPLRIHGMEPNLDPIA